jgi:hypothetical protein
MKTVRSGTAVFLVRAPEGAAATLRRKRAGVLARAAAIAALAGGAALGLAPGAAPAVGSSGQPAPAASETAAKDASRLAAWVPPRPATAPARAPVPAEASRIFAPRLAASLAQARFTKREPVVTGSFVPGEPAAAPRAGEWREEEFAQVQALDGRTLAAPSLRIRLSGLALPRADEVCRTLDGRLESCAARAATQLELVTRHRTVSCRYRLVAPGEAAGACRVGGSDLADRMIRTGFVKRLPEVGQVAMAPAPSAN